jgi:predicted NAD-dependent protein-ADP-ribosyltransferase YbiA (DUF1768 family)
MSGGNRIHICGYDLHGSEILYQCFKYTGRPDIQEKVIRMNHPLKSKWAQKPFEKQGCADEGFYENKVEVMKLCLLYKYRSSHTNKTDFAPLLHSTGDATIIEVSKRDKFWGVVVDGDCLAGENMLGRCLMWLRDVSAHIMDADFIKEYIGSYPYLQRLSLCGRKIM